MDQNVIHFKQITESLFCLMPCLIAIAKN